MLDSIPFLLKIAANPGDAGAGAAMAWLATMFGFMGVMWAFYCVLLIFGLIVFVLWLWMLIDCLKRDDFPNENDKLLWAIIMLLGGWIGALLYYFIVKRKMDAGVVSETVPEQIPEEQTIPKSGRKRTSTV
jgi:hypothetical protein